MTHIIRTPHIQRLIREAALLAEEVDMRTGPGELFERDERSVTAEEALARASNLLRRAAEELEDERQACLGWGQL